MLTLNAGSKALNQLYVLVVCVLILVQDGGVLRALRKRRDINMRWYAERPTETVRTSKIALCYVLSHITTPFSFLQASTEDASFLCILRCVVHALLRLRDPYLLSNSCAILHNLSLQLGGSLQPYTAERLVRVACQLCRRAAKTWSNGGQTKINPGYELLTPFCYLAEPHALTCIVITSPGRLRL